MQHKAAAVFAASLMFLVVFATSVGAQDDTPPAAQDQYAPGPDAECPGAVVVNTTTGTGPKQSPPFEITGERFRITIANVATSQDPSLSGVSVFVNEANGDPVTTFSQEGPGTDSSIVNAGPGRFFIETNPANSEYTVVVEDCPATDGGGGDVGDGTVPGDVIKDTIPDKVLPNTGGVGLEALLGLTVICLVLVGVGSSILRAAIRRDP